MSQPSPPAFRCGTVAIMGAPNAGKSTLLNRLLGMKIAITSKRPQTTRTRILGVVHRTGAQIILLDTPGIHQAKGPLNTRIVAAALAAIEDVDLLLWLVDAERPDPAAEAFLLERLTAAKTPVLLAINKIDRVAKTQILPLIDAWHQRYPFAAIVPVSARHGHQIENLEREMIQHLPEGPPLFPEDEVTDQPERVIVTEMIREKVFRLTGAEIPYSTAVTVEQFKTRPDRPLVDIHATIHLERDSQKAIVIGKGGAKLRQIGEAARMDIEQLLGAKVFLKLFVRVQKNWTRDAKSMQRFGYP
ncbi:MAG: GTPase Era [Desulfobacterales bacterium]|jgi:GTP-binding protein Era|nr:GTPase Era [Desulfobacterales bacterium]